MPDELKRHILEIAEKAWEDYTGHKEQINGEFPVIGVAVQAYPMTEAGQYALDAGPLAGAQVSVILDRATFERKAF